MSLKAKLEAVIYAAEEPVTLAQLAALFTADALAWKAEQAAASAGSAPADTAEPVPLIPTPLIDEAFAYLEIEQTPVSEPGEPVALESGAGGEEESAADAGESALPAAPAAEAGAESNTGAPGAGKAPAADPAEGSPGEAATDAEGDLRRQARQRDREVRAILSDLLKELMADCAADDRGVEIREIAGGYRMTTKPECHDAVRVFVRSLKPALKLSLPALETLAVIAYKQPVTAPEVNEIRGVESSATLGSLLSRKLIATAGRKPVIGRPILYKTTREFLLRFGLKDVSELPSMEEFEKMAAIELDDSALEGGGEAEPEAPFDASSDFDEEADEDADSPLLAPAEIDPTKIEAALTAPSPTEHADTEAIQQ
jgi:segregation and condensation protein B